ncbi:HlyD family secretion protein, partial [uncultured Sphingomonas sp.]|uniref:HlyD family secretion protein n=1 Tax=uncultured Sphingomonas sp. TaxID=158754 RepID=UPI0025F34BCA
MADAHQVNEGQDEGTHDAAEAEDSTPVSPGKKRRIRIILLVVAAVAIVGGVFWYANYKSVGQYMQATNDAFIQADAVTVAPKVSGYVDRVFVAENQNVQAGQPLLQIDTRDYRAQTAQIQAQIGVARANAEGVQAQIKEQQAAIDRAEADLRAAQSDAAFAQAEVARYTPLAASGAESRERLSQLQNQARQANAKVAAANAALSASRRRIGTLNAQVDQARSQGQAAKAQLDA